jgi:hypothetical protein
MVNGTKKVPGQTFPIVEYSAMCQVAPKGSHHNSLAPGEQCTAYDDPCPAIEDIIGVIKAGVFAGSRSNVENLLSGWRRNECG